MSLSGCGAPPAAAPIPKDLKSPFAGYASAQFASPSRWLCLPERANDPCKRDMSATEIAPDRSRRVETPAIALAPSVDCFYVYPTVGLSLLAGNHDDFSDVSAIEEASLAQAAHFREACALYIPLYRQITIGTYFRGPETKNAALDVAYSDVADAFLHYMATYNRGRKIVLVGHSQGAQMLTRLVQRYFDADPTMRAQLLVAILLGGEIQVPEGRASGATFANVPLCTTALQTGCVVAFRSHRAQEAVEPRWNTPARGNITACVNPATLDTGAKGLASLSRSYFPLSKTFRSELRDADDATTPFLLVRDFYRAECAEGTSGFHYLAVTAQPRDGDRRRSPVDWAARNVRGITGLHVLDFQLAQGDLVEIVRRRAESGARGASELDSE